MPILLQIDFPYDGPFGADMAQTFDRLASTISQTPGLIWKIWTENAEQQQAGGVYLFESKQTAQSYSQMHCARLEAAGIKQIRARVFEVNEALSRQTYAPL